MPSITVLYFAGARTLVGQSKEEVVLPASGTCSLSGLRDELVTRHGAGLGKLLSTSRWSVDQTMVDDGDDVVLRGGEEVAVIPPEMQAEAVAVAGHQGQEVRVKRPPRPEGCGGLRYSYDRARDGTDANVLVMFHGLGDHMAPFTTLGRSLQNTLPQTAVMSVQAPKKVPFLDDEHACMWWDSFDPFGELLTKPNPVGTVQSVCGLLAHLVDECGWPTQAVHLFGFGQGASVALETAVAFARPLGSVVAVCGGLVSHPSKPVPTPVLYVHRTINPGSQLASLRKATSQLEVEKLPPVPGMDEVMPRNKNEWDPIMLFWSKVLRNKLSWEWDDNTVRVI